MYRITHIEKLKNSINFITLNSTTGEDMYFLINSKEFYTTNYLKCFKTEIEALEYACETLEKCLTEFIKETDGCISSKSGKMFLYKYDKKDFLRIFLNEYSKADEYFEIAEFNRIAEIIGESSEEIKDNFDKLNCVTESVAKAIRELK